ncbi:tetratricopeptide repeat protein [bacterium]|nr:tetratricopeptide repeat protein [candidate division CSSED10-310 bacterium]
MGKTKIEFTVFTAGLFIFSSICFVSLSLAETPGQSAFNKGTLLMGQGKIDEAIAEFKKAIAIDQDHVDAHYNLGMAYHLKAAQKNNINIREIGSTFPKQTYRTKWTDVDELNLAIIEFKEVLRLQPNAADAHFKLGLLYDNKNDIQNALQEYREAIKLDPRGLDGQDSRANIALILFHVQGKKDEAIKELEALLEINPNHPSKENLKLMKR